MTASDHRSSRKKFLQAGGHPHMRRPYSPRPSSLLSQPALFSVSLVLCQRLVGQFALRTFKRAQIGTSKAALDTDPHHANFALGAARPLDHAREMTFQHVMHSHGAGRERNMSAQGQKTRLQRRAAPEAIQLIGLGFWLGSAFLHTTSPTGSRPK
jgi:hypothetical protein